MKFLSLLAMHFAISITHVTYSVLEEVPRFKTEYLMYAET
jgi:hypothetical protein